MNFKGKNNPNYRHGYNRTRLYKIWQDMKSRCYYINNKSYANYGGRGIRVCDKWLEFTNFLSWARGKYKNNLTIDRIDNNKSYYPNNCRFISKKENCRNRSGVKLTMKIANKIRRDYKTGNYTHKSLGIKYDISSGVIGKIMLDIFWS